VNPVTNKVYVANDNSQNITVLDGATNSITTIPAGHTVTGISVNATTNKIYAIAADNSHILVIDGSTNTIIASLVAGNGPTSIAINPNTNKVYVSSVLSPIASTNIDSQPGPLAINAVTGRIYVLHASLNEVSVIQGDTNAVATFFLGETQLLLLWLTKQRTRFMSRIGAAIA
jgi:DNA-binding beta-propeller fold protein YncE